MRISKKTCYGLRAMIELTFHLNSGPLMSESIATKGNIPKKFLDTILGELRVAGLVHGIRGAGGGYVLAKKPNDITLLNIIESLESNLDFLKCSNKTSRSLCKNKQLCAVHDLLREMTVLVRGYLGGQTLSDLAEKHEAMSVENLMYYI